MNSDEAQKLILEAITFENWLRFYFITADSEKAIIAIPHKNMEAISQRYPELAALAQDLADREVDFNVSHNAITKYIRNYLEGKKFAAGMADTILKGSDFQIALQNFQSWLQIHETVLGATFLDYKQWMNKFDDWQQAQGFNFQKKLKF